MARGAAMVPLVLLLAAGVATQSPSPALSIVTPADGSYVVGEVVIRAEIVPRSARVEQMTFFADGRLICTVQGPPYECAWNAGAAIREHGLRVVAQLPGGKRVTATVATKGVEFADAVDVDRIQVTAVVMDGTRFVRGLPRSAFRLLVDDAPVPVEYFGAEDVPLELAVGVDISESMVDAIGQTKEFVKRFLSQLGPSDKVSVIAFNENQFLIARPSVDLASRLAAVDTLATWGATALHDVIIRTFETLGRQQGRRGVVMFTDGEDTASRVSAQAVERRTEASDAVLYMIGQGRAVESASLKQLCERLAERSGGRAFFPRRIEDLGAVFDQIAEELTNQYLLTFSPATRHDGAYHRIRVEVKGGYTVRARSGYRLQTRRAR